MKCTFRQFKITETKFLFFYERAVLIIWPISNFWLVNVIHLLLDHPRKIVSTQAMRNLITKNVRFINHGTETEEFSFTKGKKIDNLD